MFDAGRLEHDFRDRMEFMGFIKKVANKKDWIVHLEPPIQMPEQVIQYVGRYSKRACLE
ncbi:transposase [Bacteroides uniformis]|nr:transposase [Bacteroides uniformis]MCO7113724.1 transposase [Bacteroides uniformis]